MKTFKTQAEEKAYYDGARDMMRAFELADPSEYAQMLSAKNEQHIMALLAQVQCEQNKVRYRDINILLRYYYINKRSALNFILSDPKDGAILGLYSSPGYDKKVTELRITDEAAIVGVFTRFIEMGDDEIVETSLEENTYLSDDRKNELRRLLSIARLNAREHWRGMVFDTERIDDNGKPVDSCSRPIVCAEIDSGEISTKE